MEKANKSVGVENKGRNSPKVGSISIDVVIPN